MTAENNMVMQPQLHGDDADRTEKTYTVPSENENLLWQKTVPQSEATTQFMSMLTKSDWSGTPTPAEEYSYGTVLAKKDLDVDPDQEETEQAYNVKRVTGRRWRDALQDGIMLPTFGAMVKAYAPLEIQADAQTNNANKLSMGAASRDERARALRERNMQHSWDKLLDSRGKGRYFQNDELFYRDCAEYLSNMQAAGMDTRFLQPPPPGVYDYQRANGAQLAKKNELLKAVEADNKHLQELVQRIAVKDKDGNLFLDPNHPEYQNLVAEADQYITKYGAALSGESANMADAAKLRLQIVGMAKRHRKEFDAAFKAYMAATNGSIQNSVRSVMESSVGGAAKAMAKQYEGEGMDTAEAEFLAAMILGPDAGLPIDVDQAGNITENWKQWKEMVMQDAPTNLDLVQDLMVLAHNKTLNQMKSQMSKTGLEQGIAALGDYWTNDHRYLGIGVGSVPEYQVRMPSTAAPSVNKGKGGTGTQSGTGKAKAGGGSGLGSFKPNPGASGQGGTGNAPVSARDLDAEFNFN